MGNILEQRVLASRASNSGGIRRDPTALRTLVRSHVRRAWYRDRSLTDWPRQFVVPQRDAVRVRVVPVVRTQGQKYDDANPPYERSLRTRVTYFDEHHPAAAYSLNNLALLLWEKDGQGRSNGFTRSNLGSARRS